MRHGNGSWQIVGFGLVVAVATACGVEGTGEALDGAWDAASADASAASRVTATCAVDPTSVVVGGTYMVNIKGVAPYSRVRVLVNEGGVAANEAVLDADANGAAQATYVSSHAGNGLVRLAIPRKLRWANQGQCTFVVTAPLSCGDGVCDATEDCALCASDCGPCPGDPPSTDCGMSATEMEAFRLLNEARATAGVPSLACDAKIVLAARAHSQDMCDQRYFSHISLDGRSPGARLTDAGVVFTSVGENIAAGYPSAQAVTDGWMASSGHRANMLNAGYTRAGIGFVSCPNGAYPTYWTEPFVQ